MLEGFHVSDARNQCICNLGLLFHAGHYNIWLHSSCPRTKSRTLGGESRTGQFDYLTCYFNWHRVQWLQQLNRSTACQAYCILHTPSLICGSRSGMIAVAICEEDQLPFTHGLAFLSCIPIQCLKFLTHISCCFSLISHICPTHELDFLPHGPI